MKVPTFWTILIKVIGLFFIFKTVNLFSDYFSTFMYMEGSYFENKFEMYTTLSAILVLFLFIIWVFLFRSFWLINGLRLSRGYEDEFIDLKANQSNVLKIVVIVVGAMIFLESLPLFFEQLYFFYQQKVFFHQSPTSKFIVYHAIRAFVAYLIITNSTVIVKFIEKFEKKKDVIVEDDSDN